MIAIGAAIDEMAFNARVFGRELAFSAVLVIGVATSLTVGLAVVNSTGPGVTSAEAQPRAAAPPPAPPFNGVAYTNTVEGVPFTANCDAPVTIRYDANGAPYDAENVVREASNEFSAAIGRPVAYELGYVDFNNPVIGHHITIGIGWTGSLPSNDERLDVLGEGGSVTRGTHVVGGHVVLAADTAWPASGNTPGSELGVVLHEIGHAAGLDHAPGGQMEAEAEASRPPGFSPAEVAALRWIFTSNCTNPIGT